MLPIDKYYHPMAIRSAWSIGPAINYEAGKLSVDGGFPREIATGLVYTKCLFDYMNQGPVIVRPPTALCRTLANTDIPVPLAEYRQPWPILGIEWPAEIGPGVRHPSLTLVWRPDPDRVWVFSEAEDYEVYHTHYAGPATIDVHIDDTPLDGMTEAEEFTSKDIGRMAMNLGLLLTHKSHRLLKLPGDVARNRRHPDPSARRRARQQAQLVLIRELEMFLAWQDRRPTPGPGDGARMLPQFRRGHWKRVAFGPGYSRRRLDWIEPYWTGREVERTPVTSVLA